MILKKVDVPIVRHSTCQDIMRTTRLGKYFALDKSFICAGGEQGRDTCKVNLRYFPWKVFKPWKIRHNIHILYFHIVQYLGIIREYKILETSRFPSS